MSIHVHKVGVNKTLGQQSDRPYGNTTINDIDESMIGDFRPDSENIETNLYDNNAAAGDSRPLRRFNGITHNDSAPHNFQFDGTDDYLGAASSSYGGNPFVMNAANAFCLAQWVKYNNVNHFAFVLNDGSDEVIVLDLNSSSGHKATVTVLSATYSVDNATTFNFTFADDTWYYIALTHDGAGNYKFYVNGSFVGSSAIGRCSGTIALEIGKYGNSYSGAGTKIGHVHVDEGYGDNSDKMMPSYLIRQRFLYTHKMHSDRIYGNTFQA